MELIGSGYSSNEVGGWGEVGGEGWGWAKVNSGLEGGSSTSGTSDGSKDIQSLVWVKRVCLPHGKVLTLTLIEVEINLLGVPIIFLYLILKMTKNSQQMIMYHTHSVPEQVSIK